MPKRNKPITKGMQKAKANANVSTSRHQVNYRVDFNSPGQGVARMHRAPAPRKR